MNWALLHAPRNLIASWCRRTCLRAGVKPVLQSATSHATSHKAPFACVQVAVSSFPSNNFHFNVFLQAKETIIFLISLFASCRNTNGVGVANTISRVCFNIYKGSCFKLRRWKTRHDKWKASGSKLSSPGEVVRQHGYIISSLFLFLGSRSFIFLSLNGANTKHRSIRCSTLCRNEEKERKPSHSIRFSLHPKFQIQTLLYCDEAPAPHMLGYFLPDEPRLRRPALAPAVSWIPLPHLQ